MAWKIQHGGRLAGHRQQIKTLFRELKASVSPNDFKKITEVFCLGIDALCNRADDVVDEWERLVEISTKIEREPFDDKPRT